METKSLGFVRFPGRAPPDLNPTTFGPAVKMQAWLEKLNALRMV
jgi:hypothetical protein